MKIIKKGLNKKGLSGVITTILLILLVIVAVSIIWVVVRALISKGTKDIEGGNVMISLSIKEARIEGTNILVNVERKIGEGEVIGLNFILSDGQTSEVIRNNTPLEEFGRKTFTVRPVSIPLANINSVSVAPIIKISSGEEKTGNVLDEICLPKICESFGVSNCGYRDDGCGDTIACTGCPLGTSCNINAGTCTIPG